MRRREKFVFSSAGLSSGLLGLQYLSVEWRYLGLALLVTATYIVNSFALSDDLQRHERLTIVPFSTLYTLVVGLFYFILPVNLISLLAIILVFGVGMYALLLVGNIFSVAKGRTIQLLHAAHAVQLLATIGMSLMFSNVLFSSNLAFWEIGGLLFVFHYLLYFMTLWSYELGETKQALLKVSRLAIYCSLIVAEMGMALALLPLSIWYNALFIMSFVYVSIGLLEHYLKNKLFERTLTEYGLVFGLMVVLFIGLFPTK